MKTIKELFEVYKPKSPDEQKFVDKHVTIKHKDRNGNDDDVFKATNVKTSKRKEERHGYEPGEDEKVYEDLEISDDELVFELDEEVEALEEGAVGYKNYTITSHPKMSGAGEGGDIKHVFGHPKKMSKLDIEHVHDDDYGTTRRVTVKNNDTGETTHHHVYQSERNNSKGKPTLSIRTVGKAGEQQEKHANVIAHYLSGKTKIKEDTDLAFFEDLLEMNLDEDTFTDASLAQLRVMKHKQEMKKIESSSKLHPLMKVRKLSDAKKKLADLEAARDLYVAKHEKAEAKKKKVVEGVEIEEKTLTPAEMKKREEVVKAVKRENPGMDKSMAYAIATKTAKRVAEETEELDELSVDTLDSYRSKARKEIIDAGANDDTRLYNKRAKGYRAASKSVNKKLTKEDIINRAIENYMPEDYTPPSLDEQFIAKIDHLSEAHAVTLLALFDSLNEDNKITMINTVDTDEGIKSLLDFAIQNRGE